MNVRKMIYITLGCVSLAIGAVGAVVPLLPSFPFLMLAAFCFARSSDRLHTWFIGTRLYRNNLESYVAGKGMTRKTKCKILTTVTLLMAFGFFMMSAVPVGRIVLAIVWVLHVVYFVFGVRTISEPDPANPKAS